MPAVATKKTGRQIVEGLFRKAHFPPVHARFRIAGAIAGTVPDSYTTTRLAGTLGAKRLHNERVQIAAGFVKRSPAAVPQDHSTSKHIV